MTTTSNGSDANPETLANTFKTQVIDKVAVRLGRKVNGYSEYISQPDALRTNDEANAVDQQFAAYCLEWLGFGKSDWNYNQPQNGQKAANRPDYQVFGSVGTAFIWEDKNSSLDLEVKHLEQMRRYCVGTAGYAVWCNMRRLLAVRFLSADTLRYETLADVQVADLFGNQFPLEDFRLAQINNLALFHLLFSKARFTEFADLTAKINVAESDYALNAVALDQPQAIRQFTSSSRQSLENLRLAALAQIRQAIVHGDSVEKQQQELKLEWQTAAHELIDVISHNQDIVSAALLKLRPGETDVADIRGIEQVLVQSQGTRQLAMSLRSHYDKWVEHANRINSVLYSRRFETLHLTRIADAYRIWSSRQSDQADVRPDIFAEQVAYVFFVRLLLVRVLEDKQVLSPRIASDGGFGDWMRYVNLHFKELDGVSILNESYCSLLSRKAGHYYLHFFQQPVFDWFIPDDYLLVQTLEFLCRYNFCTVGNDIIGFTYEEYIERNARNRKGHFLTRPEVVEYMLDLLGYVGPEVIGRRLLDPACGSGSFLVHAARRYRAALITSMCQRHHLPDAAALDANPELRQQFAADYIRALTTSFFGMELNPFACYLAEMNLLIQALDDLHVLQQAGHTEGIERFQIVNTNSLELPREILDEPHQTGTSNTITIPDRLSDRLADEAYPIKARKEEYAQGFYYIIFNPPYVSSKQEDLNLGRLMHTSFFETALSGDTNLYLLFLKLATYYLADFGQMVCIIPLTIFGDRSAAAARRLLRTPPFSPSVAVRFYRGDILFPGVDQAVGIIGVNRSQNNSTMVVSGGNTVNEAQEAQFITSVQKVIDAVPQNSVWNDVWLVTSNSVSLDIWQKVKHRSGALSYQFGTLLRKAFDMKQGDVNATHLNELRLGTQVGDFSKGHIAVYKGENVTPYAPLPYPPSDWSQPFQQNSQSRKSQDVVRVSNVLARIQQLPTDGMKQEQGIVLRETARLNTRERLLATWFTRGGQRPVVFTHKLWRFILNQSSPGSQEQTEELGKALLVALNSSSIIYLLNLFSTNNSIGREELERIPIPPPDTFPQQQLALLANQLLEERAILQTSFVDKFHAELPDFAGGNLYLPPSAVLASEPVLKLRFADLIARGEVSVSASNPGRIRALHQRHAITNRVDAARPYANAFAQSLVLFLDEMSQRNLTWQEAQNELMPDPVASPAWLNAYTNIVEKARLSWAKFVELQAAADKTVADWYGFDTIMQAAIAEGLPWARRQRPPSEKLAFEMANSVRTNQPIGQTQRLPVTSSVIYAIGYDAQTQVLEVEFFSGDVFQYAAVPPETFASFEAADSKGGFYANFIKGQFAGQKLGAATEVAAPE